MAVAVVADHSRAMGLQEDDSDCCCPFPAMEAIEDIAIDCEWMSFFSGGGLESTFFGWNCALVASQVFSFESLPHLSTLLLWPCAPFLPFHTLSLHIFGCTMTIFWPNFGGF